MTAPAAHDLAASRLMTPLRGMTRSVYRPEASTVMARSAVIMAKPVSCAAGAVIKLQ